MSRFLRLALTLPMAGLAGALGSCARAEVGARENPLTMYFVPSVDAQTIAVNADALTRHVERFVSRRLYGTDQGFHVESAIPASYIAVVEAFGTGRADFAALNTFSYVLARDIKKYDVRPLVTVVRGDGELSFRGQIIARTDSGIDSIEDLRGKRFAYTDPASTTGYILPSKMFEREGIELGETVFAMKHDNVVMQVYQGQVDAGATYHSPPVQRLVGGSEVEVIRDARARVLTQLPDVVERIKIIGFTMETPNEPWVLRGNLFEDPARQKELEGALRDALLDFASTSEGLKTLDQLYSVTGLAAVDESVYDEIRAMVLDADLDLDAAVRK